MTWLLLLLACGGGQADAPQTSSGSTSADRDPPPTTYANVDHVLATGNPGAYRFSVTVLSPDTGCEQYADWWEVLRPDGTLLYRRILGHSHVEEQPFSRAGGPVAVAPNAELLVRAHMSEAGYGGRVLRGTVETGFVEADDVAADFATDVADKDPQPTDCAF